jgi:PhnB protein
LRISTEHAVATTGVGRLSSIASGFCLAITVANEAEADRVFAALADGGKVQMPFGKTFFSPRFCIVADRLGVAWMVIVPA